MNAPNIYTLLMIVRGFSNEVTVRGLATDLGISYSTLARCKNGIWPRSITLESMCDVFEKCRERFFDGDGDALANAVLLQLKDQGLDTSTLDTVLEQEGYNAFLSELLTMAHHSNRDEGTLAKTVQKPPTTKATPIQDLPHSTEPPERVQDPAYSADPLENIGQLEQPKSPSINAQTLNQPQDSPPIHSTNNASRMQDLAFAIPIAIVLLLGMFNASLYDAFVWAEQNRLAFFVISLFVALMPAIVGTFVDAPLAWLAYKRQKSDVPFTLQTFAHVAKYGTETGIAQGSGRFNLTLSYFAYQPVCNICGMMCYIFFFSFLLTLPGFDDFFLEHEWIEFFKAGIAVAFFIAYSHARDQYHRLPLNEVADEISENPDNYLPTRVHVWANTIHLVWSISLTIVLALSFVAYSIVRYRAMGMPLLMLWPFLHAMLFFAYSCTSKAAIRIRATAVGILFPSVVATCAGLTMLNIGMLPPFVGKRGLVRGLCCVRHYLCPMGTQALSRQEQRSELVGGRTRFARIQHRNVSSHTSAAVGGADNVGVLTCAIQLSASPPAPDGTTLDIFELREGPLGGIALREGQLVGIQFCEAFLVVNRLREALLVGIRLREGENATRNAKPSKNASRSSNPSNYPSRNGIPSKRAPRKENPSNNPVTSPILRRPAA